MKTVIFVLSIGLFFASCNSNNPGSNVSDYETNEALYKRAIGYSDYGTALVALNLMLMEDSTNLEYTDSLARLYLKSGNFDAGLSLGKTVMADNPKNYTLLELIAAAQEYKGDAPNLTKAYRNYKKLHEALGETKYLLKVAQVSMIQGNGDGAKLKLEDVLANGEGGYIESATSNGGSQLVDVKAVANWLLSNYYFSKGNEQKGVKHLEESLRISPDYDAANVMVKQLQQMQYQQQQQQASAGQQQAYQQQLNRQADIERKKAEQKRLEEQFLKGK
jgi:tetratricopeptide (TPR) repeat protein